MLRNHCYRKGKNPLCKLKQQARVSSIKHIPLGFAFLSENTNFYDILANMDAAIDNCIKFGLFFSKNLSQLGSIVSTM